MTRKQKKMLYRIGIAAVLVVLLQCVPFPNIYIKALAFFIPYGVIGYDILRKAFRGILNGQVFDENFLMAVATVGAMLLGEFTEGVAVMLFYQIGELFQSYAVGKSRKSIMALMDIRPDYANLEVNGETRQVSPEEVLPGSIIVLHPGERIPLDGEVIGGSGSVDTSALTGESMPREVQPGDDVISGCINMSGLLRVRTTKEFGESTVSKILEMVEESGMRKSRSEQFITKFARVYTPAVCIAALGLAVLPPLFLGLVLHRPFQWSMWVIRALTFLVISCPCALVISIPLSFFGGIGGASARGILIKGSTYLEALAHTSCVVFDKTGTMTKGSFEVVETVPSAGITSGALLYYAAGAEKNSHHPISESIQTAYLALEGAKDNWEIGAVQEAGGFGVEAVIDGRSVLVGNERLMEKFGLAPKENISSALLGCTRVHVAWDGVYAGCIYVADTLKSTAISAVKALKAHGVTKTVMLTGDHNEVAKAVGEKLGVDLVYGELLPGDKVIQVERLLEEKSGKQERLAFVGDGINDAPVLSRADIGIAMGAMGSDAAIEAADIVLMDDDPEKLVIAMKISKKTLNIVYQNIVFALGIKGLCLLLGAFGVANMWMAIFADVGVMVLAVLNATRALQTKRL